MEKLIIQQNRRHGRLSEFIKSEGDTLTLGRGLNNDVILSDHFVAEEQIRFVHEDGQWKLKLLDDTNPVLINNKPVENEVVITSGDNLNVGRTHLKLLLSNHSIERTRKLMLSNWMYHKVFQYVFPVIMLLASILLVIFSDYQETTSKVRWGQLVGDGLGYMLFIVFLAGCWALVGRLLRHKPNFFIQLFYISLMLSVLSIAMLFTGYVEYATTYETLGYIFEWGILLFILGVLLKYNFTYATELKKRSLVSFTVIAVSMLFIVAIDYLEKRDFTARAEYSKTVKPPLAKWSSDMSVDNYLQIVESRFSELEKLTKVNEK